MQPYAILFVCAGNICRSPLAEGIFLDVAERAGRQDRLTADSAGTGGWHRGDAPDARSVDVARSHGIDISAQRARQVTPVDFDRFDLVLAMDHDNLHALERLCPSNRRARLHLFSRYALGTDDDIPDPYYGGRDGFETVYTMLLTGCSALVEKV